MASTKHYDYTLKILVLGDSGVGKTSLIHMFCDNMFSNSYLSTIGIDSKTKTITIDDDTIRLQIWDTAGQERFRTLTTAYYRGAMGVVHVFDVGNEDSFKSIRHWIENVDEKATRNVQQVLVGNKCDIGEDNRAVTYARGEKHASDFGVPYFETSAKFGNCVKDVFLELTKKIKKQKEAKVFTSYPQPDLFVEESKDREKSGVCC